MRPVADFDWKRSAWLRCKLPLRLLWAPRCSPGSHCGGPPLSVGGISNAPTVGSVSGLWGRVTGIRGIRGSAFRGPPTGSSRLCKPVDGLDELLTLDHSILYPTAHTPQAGKKTGCESKYLATLTCRDCALKESKERGSRVLRPGPAPPSRLLSLLFNIYLVLACV